MPQDGRDRFDCQVGRSIEQPKEANITAIHCKVGLVPDSEGQGTDSDATYRIHIGA